MTPSRRTYRWLAAAVVTLSLVAWPAGADSHRARLSTTRPTRGSVAVDGFVVVR